LAALPQPLPSDGDYSTPGARNATAFYTYTYECLTTASGAYSVVEFRFHPLPTGVLHDNSVTIIPVRAASRLSMLEALLVRRRHR
jgi:hypothetical protein